MRSNTAFIGAAEAQIDGITTNARASSGTKWGTGYVDISFLDGQKAAISVRLDDARARYLMARLRESIQFLDDRVVEADSRVIRDQSKEPPDA